jgi:hypothetical protein
MGSREITLKSLNLKKLAAVAAFGLVAMLGTSEVANAQGNRDRDRHDNDRYDKQQRKIDKQNAKVARERARLEQQRLAMWNAQNQRVLAEQQRQIQWSTRNTGGTAFDWGSNSMDQNSTYRVYRNGSYYQTDYRGAELLRQAVNEGYRQGFRAGRSDRGGNVRFSWSNSNVYRSGTYGYQNHVTRSQYQYYFQQGFQRGYQDGSNSRYDNDYNGQYEYGYYENGSLNILGNILNTVLNIRRY